MADQYVRMPNGEYVQIPEGTSPEVTQRAIRGYLEGVNSQRGTGERIARGVGMVGQGFNEGLAQTAGALPDLVASGMRAVGIPTSAPGQYTDWARQGIQYVTGAPQVPETTTERALQGAGRGVADAASVMMPATALAQGARAGSVAQGVGQALAAQPVAQTAAGAIGGAVGDATDSPLLGTAAAVATPLLAAAGRRVVTPLPVSQGRQELVAAAQREGIPITPGQASGNSALRYMEGTFENLPTTAGRQAGIVDRGQRAFNRAVLSRAGIQGDSAMPDVLAANRQRLGNEFDRLAAATTVNFDPPFVRQLGAAARQYGDKLPSQQRPIFQNFMRDILTDPATGQARATMPGEMYQQARSDLERLRTSYRNSDPALSDALRQLRNALDDVAGRSVPPDMRDAWHTARRQWSNQRTVERAITAGENVAEGNISPLTLRQGVNRRDQGAYALGRGDLAELARVGQGLMRPMPQSGTGPRNMMIGALTGAGVAGMDPMTLAAGAAVPRAIQEVYNLGPVQSYLRNQAMPGGGVNQNLLAAIAGQQGLAEGRAAVTNSR